MGGGMGADLSGGGYDETGADLSGGNESGAVLGAALERLGSGYTDTIICLLTTESLPKLVVPTQTRYMHAPLSSHDTSLIINIIKTEEDTATNVVIGSGSCTCQECCTGIHPLSDLAGKVQGPACSHLQGVSQEPSILCPLTPPL
jgi:hypothetical protein